MLIKGIKCNVDTQRVFKRVLHSKFPTLEKFSLAFPLLPRLKTNHLPNTSAGQAECNITFCDKRNYSVIVSLQ